MSDLIYEDDFIIGEHRTLERVVVVTRTSNVPDTDRAASFVRSYQQCVAEFTKRNIVSDRLILDVSKAPGNNDSNFEGSMNVMLEGLRQVFPQIVFVVGSAAGALQLRRLMVEIDGVRVERSLTDALAVLDY